jgi:apolipoprotein N-acyltransferase
MPFPFTLLIFVALIPYLSVIEHRTRLIDINRATYLMAFMFGLLTIYWVGSWTKEADPFLMISGGLLLFVNPAIFMIASTIFYFSKKIFPRNVSLYLFPVFWVAYEYAYMITDLSFPWLTLGNGLPKFTAFIQIADIIGTLGLTLLIFYINIFFYKAWINFNEKKILFNKYLLIALLLFILPLIYGYFKLSTYKISNEKIKIGLIQPNLDPWAKWQGGNLENLINDYLNLSRRTVNEGAQIVIWPETALPVYLMSGQYPNIVDSIYNFIESRKIFLLTGMPDINYYFEREHAPSYAKYSENGNYYYTIYNGVLLFSPYTREIQHYGKMKLVPFGEKVPFSDKLPFLGDLIKWGVGISGWNAGQDTTDFSIPIKYLENPNQNKLKLDTLKINTLVCYESIYPDFVAQFVKRGADLITVVTNDSWYGKTSGPYQHKEIAALRAVENRRTVLRAANGGVSCIIDPLGRTLKESKLFTKTYLVVDAPLEKDETFFTNNPLIIPLLSSAFSIWIIGIFILKKLKEKFNL